MDGAYLEAFTDRRFEHFAHGQSPGPDLIGEAIRAGEAPQAAPDADRLMRSVYGFTEKIHRVDLASRYPFHSLVPGARNMRTAKILFMAGGRVHAYDPYRNRIVAIGFTEDPAFRLVLMTDDRRLQRFYGEFSRMLSALNTGHALFNLEFALWQAGYAYGYVPAGSEPAADSLSSIHIRPRAAVRIGSEDDERRDGTLKPVSERLFSVLAREHFVNRTADQRGEGDVFFHRILPLSSIESLLKLMGPRMEAAGIRLFLAVNDVEGLVPGYYRLIAGGLVFIRPFDDVREYERLLREYHEFSNFQGFNFWAFMTFSKDQTEKDAELLFIEMGRLMQFLSVFMAGEHRAVRCLKNYDDAYFRSKTGLPDDMAIGYSAVVFPDRNQAMSVRIPDVR